MPLNCHLAVEMDYNDNAENTEIITTNQAWNGIPFHLVGKNLTSGNDVIRNRPIRFNSTSDTDNFIGCDNLTDNKSWNMDPSNEEDNQAYGNDQKLCSNTSPKKKRPDLNIDGAKNQVTWQQLSPKKEIKIRSQSSSGSSSSSQSSPTRSWKSDSSEGKNQVTWRDVSPTKGRKGKEKLKTSPEHVCLSPSKKQAVNENEIRKLQFSPEHGYASLNMKVNNQNELNTFQCSPEHLHASSNMKVTNQNELKKLQCSPEHKCSNNVTSATANQNEMNSQLCAGNGSACPCHHGSHGNEKTTNQAADNIKGKLKISEKGVAPSPEDAFNNDYFYDEDFTVQFDTNLRESSPGLNCTCIDPALMLDFPHMLTGSYLSFNNIKGSSSVLDQNTTDIFCPDESELSCSRNSAMDVSSSEREMMCSSDMLDFSDNPIFTPSPTKERPNQAIVSTDSLDKVRGQNQSLELSMSQTSSTGNLCMDCCPRRDAYFLSFDGSGQGRTASTSDIENSTNSFGSGQGQIRYHSSDISTGSGEDMEDESSDSFHFCYSSAHQAKPHHSPGKKFQPLDALHEKPLERSQLSDDLRVDCLKKSLSPKKDSKHLKLSGNKNCVCTPKKLEGQGQSVSNGNSPSRSVKSWTRSKPKSVTSWKQIKSLRRLGKVQSKMDTSKSNSMPELCLCSWQSVSSQGHHDLHAMAESFHGNRHSAYLLELYQRIKNQSNPVSPEAMANIEQILFQPMIGQNHNHGDKGFLKLDEHCCELCKEDSHSSNTLTNSRPHHRGTSGTNHLESATRKRILEWLDKETKCCQTETVKKSKETLISPVTVTLWCGTKNFGSQFPPAAKDCAIQTSVEESKEQHSNAHDAMQQTSPIYEKNESFTERNEVLNMIPKDFSELEDILPQPRPTPKNVLPRSKSADSNRMLSMQNQSSSFYSHKSLPDLSFLLPKSCQGTNHKCSIFDPLPNPMPIPALVPNAEQPKSRGDSGRSSPRLSHHHREDVLPHCRVNHRSRSAPSRLVNQNLTRNFAESGSSSSGFSTSSTSSGIDPGYSEPRTLQHPYCYRDNTSPCNDIERLLFYPPHVESSVKKDNSCKHEQSDEKCNHVNPQQVVPRQNLARKSKLTDKKVNKYANEVFPNFGENKPKNLNTQKGNTVSGSSSNSSFNLEHLYSLQEEKTPVSSPEQHSNTDGCHSNKYCYHDNTYCEVGTYGYCQYEQNVNCGSDWDQAQEVILRRKFDLDIGGHLSSESCSSSGGSLIPNFDRKPLKSCLRKKQFLRSRSMSDPFSLMQQLEQQKQAVKKVNRHSYACEEVYLLTDETGEYFLYQNDSENEEPMLFYLENNDNGNTQTVKRRQKNVENETSSGDNDKDLSGKRKSVSFASEVSFHAISPQMSPKHQAAGQSQDSDGNTIVERPALTDTTDDIVESSDSDTPPTEFKVSNSPPDGVSPTDHHQMSPPKQSSSDQSLTEQLDRKRAILTELTSAAESLLNHFAEAKNPFDKLRLGNSADTPEIGELVLSKLCPLICQLLGDGLKQHVTGVHVFGRVKVTVWKVAEASAELGPYTRAIHELVQQLKSNPGLVSCNNKFDAFIFGLLNLRLLDFWIGYIRHNETITKKYYNTDGVILLGQSYLQMAFDQMLISLQPLAILPFQLGFEFIVQRSASKVTDKSPVSSPTSEQPKPLVSPTTEERNLIQDDKNANQIYTTAAPAKPPRLQQNNSIFSATKAWDWLKGSTNQEGSSSVLPKTSDMMSSISEMFGKLTGKNCDSTTQKSSDAKETFASIDKKLSSTVETKAGNSSESMRDNSCSAKKDINCDKNYSIDSKKKVSSDSKKDNPSDNKKSNTCDAKEDNSSETKKGTTCDMKKDQPSDTKATKKSENFVTLEKKEYQGKPDLDASSSKDENRKVDVSRDGVTIATEKIVKDEKSKTIEVQQDVKVFTAPSKPNGLESKVNNSLSSAKKDIDNIKSEKLDVHEQSEKLKENDLADISKHKGNNSTEDAKLKGDNSTDKVMKRSLTDLAQNLFGRTPNTYKRGITEYKFNEEKEKLEVKQNVEMKGEPKVKPVFSRSRSLVENRSCDIENEAAACRKNSLEQPKLDTGVKSKSGIIKLFDKLLLPRPSLLRQPQPIGKSFSSGEIQQKPIKSTVTTADSPQLRANSGAKKTKYRWSWSVGQSKNKCSSGDSQSSSEKSLELHAKEGCKEQEVISEETSKKTNMKNSYVSKLPRQTFQPKSKERGNSFIHSDNKVKKGENIGSEVKGHVQSSQNNSSSESVSLELGPVVKAPAFTESKTNKHEKKSNSKSSKISQPKIETVKGDNSSSKLVKPGSYKKGTSLSG